jgi:hypothetical protein
MDKETRDLLGSVDGFWLAQLKDCADAFTHSASRHVTGRTELPFGDIQVARPDLETLVAMVFERVAVELLDETTRMHDADASCQKRLGHASPESTKIYTRISDQQVLAVYTRALEAQR